MKGAPLLIVILLLAAPANAADWGRAVGALFARQAVLAGDSEPDRPHLPVGEDVRVPAPIEP